MALYGKQYTVTATAVAPLAASPASKVIDTTSTTNPGHIQIQSITFRAKAGNTGPVYIGNSDVTNSPTNALGVLYSTATASDGWTDGPFQTGSQYADAYFVVGTANDTVFIEVVPY